MPKAHNILSPADWFAVRAEYESTAKPPLRILASKYGCDLSTIASHAKRESWHRCDSLALATIKRIENDSSAIVEKTAANVTEQLTKHLSDTLQPWLEREKTKHLRSQIKRSKLALRQLDNHIDASLILSPKDSSFVAKSAETWDNIMRKSLGLNDSGVIPGSLTLNVLTDHAAVQVKTKSD